LRENVLERRAEEKCIWTLRNQTLGNQLIRLRCKKKPERSRRVRDWAAIQKGYAAERRHNARYGGRSDWEKTDGTAVGEGGQGGKKGRSARNSYRGVKRKGEVLRPPLSFLNQKRAKGSRTREGKSLATVDRQRNQKNEKDERSEEEEHALSIQRRIDLKLQTRNGPKKGRRRNDKNPPISQRLFLVVSRKTHTTHYNPGAQPGESKSGISQACRGEEKRPSRLAWIKQGCWVADDSLQGSSSRKSQRGRSRVKKEKKLKDAGFTRTLIGILGIGAWSRGRRGRERGEDLPVKGVMRRGTSKHAPMQQYRLATGRKMMPRSLDSGFTVSAGMGGRGPIEKKRKKSRVQSTHTDDSGPAAVALKDGHEHEKKADSTGATRVKAKSATSGRSGRRGYQYKWSRAREWVQRHRS